MLASGEAKSRSAAARQLNVHRNTVSDWLTLYESVRLNVLRHIHEGDDLIVAEDAKTSGATATQLPVPLMPAREMRHPVAFLVLVVAGDCAFHASEASPGP